MNSKEIQASILEWARKRSFTAPYGILDGEHTNKKGIKYKSVTFGYARTLDASVDIYNRNFMIYRSSRGADEVFKNYDDLMTFLNNNFPKEVK